MSITKQISIRLDEAVLAEIDAEAVRMKVSRNWVISRRLENSRTLPPLYGLDTRTGAVTKIDEVGPEKNTARENHGGENVARGDENKVRGNQGDCVGVGSDGGEDEGYGGTVESKNGGAGSVGKKLVPRKKIADVSAGAQSGFGVLADYYARGMGAQGVGATPPCPDTGKAQLDGGIGDEIDYLDQERYLDKKAAGRKAEVVWPVSQALVDGVPCGHAGCLSHISHPCEGCGRVGGVHSEKNRGVGMQALRDICAGKISPNKFHNCGDEMCHRCGKCKGCEGCECEPIEVDLCGEKFYNEVDGENYICGLEKHGPKIHHGEWIKI